MTTTITAPVATAPVTDKTATKGIKAKVDRLREIRAIIKPLETESKELTAEILAWAGDGIKRIVWGKTQLATIVDNVNRRNSADVLKQGFPEAYEASLVEVPFKQVR